MDRKAAGGVEDVRRLLKSVCKPVVMPPEFKKRLFDRLMREAKSGRQKEGVGDLNPHPLSILPVVYY